MASDLISVLLKEMVDGYIDPSPRWYEEEIDMNYYKTFKLKKRDIKFQCTITIPQQVVHHLDFQEGDELRLTVEKDMIVIRKVKTRK